MAISRRSFLLSLVSIVNYTADLLLIILWRNIFLGYFMSVVIGFIIGLVAMHFRDFLALMLSSYIFASFLSISILILPALLRSEIIWFQIQASILGATAIIAYNSFVMVPFSVLSGFFGLFVCDRLVKVSRT
ncbi:MAG: hypothetical protein QW175_01760 [Candidatus Bathyarchaeia archaeon]